MYLGSVQWEIYVNKHLPCYACIITRAVVSSIQLLQNHAPIPLIQFQLNVFQFIFFNSNSTCNHLIPAPDPHNRS